MQLTPSAARRPQRADARRNRALLLRAGAELLGRHGADFAFSSVASAAGVGAGTLHRHFPTKSSLLLALYLKDIEAVADEAQTRLVEPDARTALAEWLTDLAAFGWTRPGVNEAFRSGLVRADGAVVGAYQRVVRGLDALLQKAVPDGCAPTRADDVLIAIAGVWDLPASAGRSEQRQRIVTLIMRGIDGPGGR